MIGSIARGLLVGSRFLIGPWGLIIGVGVLLALPCICSIIGGGTKNKSAFDALKDVFIPSRPTRIEPEDLSLRDVEDSYIKQLHRLYLRMRVAGIDMNHPTNRSNMVLVLGAIDRNAGDEALELFRQYFPNQQNIETLLLGNVYRIRNRYPDVNLVKVWGHSARLAEREFRIRQRYSNIPPVDGEMCYRRELFDQVRLRGLNPNMSLEQAERDIDLLGLGP